MCLGPKGYWPWWYMRKVHVEEWLVSDVVHKWGRRNYTGKLHGIHSEVVLKEYAKNPERMHGSGMSGLV